MSDHARGPRCPAKVDRLEFELAGSSSQIEDVVDGQQVVGGSSCAGRAATSRSNPRRELGQPTMAFIDADFVAYWPERRSWLVRRIGAVTRRQQLLVQSPGPARAC
jgi:hypothetical protein